MDAPNLQFSDFAGRQNHPKHLYTYTHQDLSFEPKPSRYDIPFKGCSPYKRTLRKTTVLRHFSQILARTRKRWQTDGQKDRRTTFPVCRVPLEICQTITIHPGLSDPFSSFKKKTRKQLTQTYPMFPNILEFIYNCIFNFTSSICDKVGTNSFKIPIKLSKCKYWY